MVTNVAWPSVFDRLYTLAFYAAVKSRQVFALLLQSPPDASFSHLAPPTPISLFYIPRPLNGTSCGKRGERFEESHKAEALVQRAALRQGGGCWWGGFSQNMSGDMVSREGGGG